MTANNTIDVRVWLLLAAILSIGALLRGAYFREIRQSPEFDDPVAIDSDYHDDWARGLALGEWAPRLNTDPHIRDTPYFRPPGYPFFLAALYGTIGPDYHAVRIIQMGIGLLTCGLVFVLAGRCFDSAVALLAGALATFYWVFIYYEGELHEPVLLVFLAVALVLVLSSWVTRLGAARSLAAGMILGAMAVVRPNVLLFIPCVVWWCWWIAPRGWRRRASAIAALCFCGGTALVIAPVTVRNRLVGGEFVLISGNAGLQLWVGNNPVSTGVGDGGLPALEQLAGIRGWTSYDYPRMVRGLEHKLGRPISYPQASRYFARQALDFIMANPGRWLTLTAIKTAVFWGPLEFDSNKELHFARLDSPLLRHLPLGFSAIASAALFGTFIAFRRRAPRYPQFPGDAALSPPQFQIVVLMQLFVVAYSVSFLPFAITTRYRLPVVPFLMILGAYAACTIVRFICKGRVRSLAGWGLGLAASFTLLNHSFVPFAPDEHSYHYLRGAAYGHQGDWAQAAHAYRAALALKPDDPDTRFNLGNALAGLGQLDDAVDQWRRALQRKPTLPDAHNNLANALVRQGRLHDAIDHYRASVELDPQDFKARYNLAAALVNAGNLTEAVEHYTAALRLRPDSAAVHNDLAIVFRKLGRLDEAIDHYETSLRIEPGNAAVLVNLGRALYSRRNVDQAVGVFRRAVEIDPQSIDAHLALGSIGYERGEFDEAIAHFRRILELDPAHVEARRLLDAATQRLPAEPAGPDRR